MSVDHDARLLVGTRLDKIYEAEVREEEQTRYHEETGKPYTIKVRMLHAKFGNKQLAPVKLAKRPYGGWREEAYQEWEFLEQLNLGVYAPSSEGYGDTDYLLRTALVGISSVEGKSCESSLEHLTNIAAEVKKALAKFGYEGPINVYAQMTYG